jgi:hypothetical protein
MHIFVKIKSAKLQSLSVSIALLTVLILTFQNCGRTGFKTIASSLPVKNYVESFPGICGTATWTPQLETPVGTTLCATGHASSVQGAGPWNWSCYGSNGTTIDCTTSVRVNGICGEALTWSSTDKPADTTLCTAGTAASLSATAPWSWSCAGNNTGTTANCSNTEPINGHCGYADQKSSVSVPGNSDLCSNGNSTEPSENSNGKGWTWSCNGINSGTIASCASAKMINGSCGSANATTLMSPPTASDNLCTTGTASPIITLLSSWTWQCMGENQGTSSQCMAESHAIKLSIDLDWYQTNASVDQISANYGQASSFLALDQNNIVVNNYSRGKYYINDLNPGARGRLLGVGSAIWVYLNEASNRFTALVYEPSGKYYLNIFDRNGVFIAKTPEVVNGNCYVLPTDPGRFVCQFAGANPMDTQLGLYTVKTLNLQYFHYPANEPSNSLPYFAPSTVLPDFFLLPSADKLYVKFDGGTAPSGTEYILSVNGGFEQISAGSYDFFNTGTMVTPVDAAATIKKEVYDYGLGQNSTTCNGQDFQITLGSASYSINYIDSNGKYKSDKMVCTQSGMLGFIKFPDSNQILSICNTPTTCTPVDHNQLGMNSFGPSVGNALMLGNKVITIKSYGPYPSTNVINVVSLNSSENSFIMTEPTEYGVERPIDYGQFDLIYHGSLWNFNGKLIHPMAVYDKLTKTQTPFLPAILPSPLNEEIIDFRKSGDSFYITARGTDPAHNFYNIRVYKNDGTVVLDTPTSGSMAVLSNVENGPNVYFTDPNRNAINELNLESGNQRIVKDFSPKILQSAYEYSGSIVITLSDSNGSNPTSQIIKANGEAVTAEIAIPNGSQMVNYLYTNKTSLLWGVSGFGLILVDLKTGISHEVFDNLGVSVRTPSSFSSSFTSLSGSNYVVAGSFVIASDGTVKSDQVEGYPSSNSEVIKDYLMNIPFTNPSGMGFSGSPPILVRAMDTETFQIQNLPILDPNICRNCRYISSAVGPLKEIPNIDLNSVTLIGIPGFENLVIPGSIWTFIDNGRVGLFIDILNSSIKSVDVTTGQISTIYSAAPNQLILTSTNYLRNIVTTLQWDPTTGKNQTVLIYLK